MKKIALLVRSGLQVALLFVGVLGFFVPIFAQESFDCDQLVGTWIGEYEYEGGYLEKWEAVYSEEGSFAIEFFDAQDEFISDGEGTWQCDGVWVTSTISQNEQEYSFSYQIRELNVFRYVYESEQGPIFTSFRKQD